ncbi:MAG: helix-turn-helix domain-containing protein [Clostridia bacterium]|nr:helix-turn-helix domain-containing protein [Clostridia bacterium]
MRVVDKIKIYLVKEHISQKELSEKTGIPQPKLSMSLNGTRKLTVDEFETIVNALSISANEFIEEKILEKGA